MLEQLVNVKRRLVIDVLEQKILYFADSLELFFEILVVKQLADLEAYLRILVRIKRSYAALCRAEFLSLRRSSS